MSCRVVADRHLFVRLRQTGPIPLEGSVSATLQGGYVAVDRLREALGAAFAVLERGTASGDQEKEVDLRLGTKR